MNDSTTKRTILTRQLVPEDQRLDVTAELFGIHFPLAIEPVIYGITERMAQDNYHGGYWHYYQLACTDWQFSGFYMAPDGDHTYQVSCDNYWQGELSADALGIVSTLYAYSHLSFSRDEQFGRLCARHYHLLREYIYEHPELPAILGAID